jgi:nicotinamide-nucleotide adenylyltransferase
MILLGIGSAQLSHTRENPFTAGERMEMALRAVEEAGLDRVIPVPLLDIDRHGLWVRYLENLLPPFQRVYTNNPLTRLLFEEAQYEVVSPSWQERELLEGTAIRHEMVTGTAWEARVPRAVRAYLLQIHAPERLRLLDGGSTRPASRGGR